MESLYCQPITIIKPWWEDSGVITQLQGACKEEISCLHTAFFLQESISEQLETNMKVFITYLDVSKAFDRVWINELFFCIRDLGIFGKTWRLFIDHISILSVKLEWVTSVQSGTPCPAGHIKGAIYSFIGLGWIRIEIFVYVKKLLFVRTTAMLEDESIYATIFLARAIQLNNDKDLGFDNLENSPCFDILKVS